MAVELSARVLNRAGCCVGYYNQSEFGDACEVVADSDRVEIYGDEYAEGAGGCVGLVDEWRETLTGAEFKRLYGGAE